MRYFCWGQALFLGDILARQIVFSYSFTKSFHIPCQREVLHHLWSVYEGGIVCGTSLASNITVYSRILEILETCLNNE